MMDQFPDWASKFTSLPAYSLAGVIVMLLQAIQSEVRFGAKARSIVGDASDRGSTIAVSVAAAVPIAGLVLAIYARKPGVANLMPSWLGPEGSLPGMPAIAWAGVGIASLGLLLRLWALLKLRWRYSRTLVVQSEQTIERSGPYRIVRHPGYLGSLLTLNGIALTSGNTSIVLASLAATSVAYVYRVRVEEAMLVSAFGAPYESYRGEVSALLPFIW
jgi:protein-S-isoprenylcysteine O-methyltransferase